MQALRYAASSADEREGTLAPRGEAARRYGPVNSSSEVRRPSQLTENLRQNLMSYKLD